MNRLGLNVKSLDFEIKKKKRMIMRNLVKRNLYLADACCDDSFNFVLVPSSDFKRNRDLVKKYYICFKRG